MEFSLYYRGPLRANADATEKHRRRKLFHQQLKVVWSQPPLDDEHDLLNPIHGPKNTCILKSLGAFQFAPLITEPLFLVGELEITMLRPQPPGSIVTRGGDIDNRLKTLLDALSMPPEVGALPDGVEPDPEESPFFCLLEDDKLLTRVSVATDRLLDT